MGNDHLEVQWQKLSEPWIKESRNGPNANRSGLLDEPMLSACGSVIERDVLDSGCGEGRFCRMLRSLGAREVVGVDLCSEMISAARELQSEGEEYIQANVEDLSFLENKSFDLSVSYLNQCDLRDWKSNTREVYRVLRKGGKFVVCNLHPMRSATGYWEKDSNGAKKHVILDDYFRQEERTWKMMGVELTNFHRTLEAYVSGFMDIGFSLEGLQEPSVTEENLQKYPILEDELRVPNFIIFKLLKP
ncbi:MAG: class I SAM-dependent methyltransferase [Verrucomicrobiota bacterium]